VPRVSAPKRSSGGGSRCASSFCSCRIAASTLSVIGAAPVSTSRTPSLPAETAMLLPAPAIM
jgi:hypothetical protein